MRSDADLNLATILLVFAGGTFGATLRYAVDRLIQSHRDAVFPLGTLSVNVVGSALLGLLAGAARGAGLPDEVLLLAGAGFCGALTTYSTFGFETVRLIEEGAMLEAATNTVASLTLGLAAVLGGIALGSTVWA